MGHGFLRLQHDDPNGTKELAMSPMKRYATKQAKASKRRRLKAQERLKQQRAQAQHSIEASHQALKDLDIPDTLLAMMVGVAFSRNYGNELMLVGTCYSWRFNRTVPAMDGVLLVAVIENGKLIIPLDFAIRRPNPKSAGRRCHDKLRLT